jgi:lipoprotein-releasing system permease protein
MGISLSNQTDLMELWYPKRSKKISLGEINPEKNFNRRFILPVGIFAVEQQYDEKYVFVPLSFAESLLEYNQRRTSLEIKVKPNYGVAQVQKALQKKLGSQFVVQNTDEQQAGLLKAIQIEKFFVYITLSFVLAVASFNIFFSLTMLAIEKKKDIAVLYTLGAEVGTIRRIFIFEGVLISLIGATLGMTTGLGICLLQQQFGIIPMGTATTIVSAYPVELRLNDFLFSSLSVIIITLLSSVPPALRIDPTQVKAYL